MKIVLIGFMGTGKTTLAPILAKRFGLESIEMDDLIISKAGGKSIPGIFKAGGEAAFRELESGVSKGLADTVNVVISTGGGVVSNEATIDYLTKGAIVIELNASFDTVLKRIDPKMPRPLFQDPVEAQALYERRKPLYSKYAAITVTTDDKSVDEVVEEIISKLQNQ